MTDNESVKRRSGRFWRLFFSGLLALLIGVPLCVSGLITAMLIRYDTELELSARMVDGILLFVPTVAIWGGFILIMVALILVLPVLRFRGLIPLSKWFVSGSAFLGGVLGAISPLRRWYGVTFSQYELWTSPDYVNWSYIWVILAFAGGALFGGLYGGWVVFLERRAARSVGGVDISADGNGSAGGARRWGYGSWAVYGVAVVTVLWLAWLSSSAAREIEALTQVTLKLQAGVLEDARILLKEGAGVRNGYASFWRGDEGPALKQFSLLGEVYCRTSKYYPEVVEVEIAGSRRGLYVVPEPTSATVAMLRARAQDGRFEYLKVVNEHVYQFGRTLW